MAICAVAWLVAHVRMLGRDEREKPQTMIRQLVTPLFGENTLQFYNERYRQMKRTGWVTELWFNRWMTICLFHLLPSLPVSSSWVPSWSTCVPTSSSRQVRRCARRWRARSPYPTATCCQPKTPSTRPSASSSRRCCTRAGWTAEHCICSRASSTWAASSGSPTTWWRWVEWQGALVV